MGGLSKVAFEFGAQSVGALLGCAFVLAMSIGCGTALRRCDACTSSRVAIMSTLLGASAMVLKIFASAAFRGGSADNCSFQCDQERDPCQTKFWEGVDSDVVNENSILNTSPLTDIDAFHWTEPQGFYSIILEE